MEIQNSYIETLKAHLANRQGNNPDYSLRAYGRDLKVHPSTLSQVLNGKKNLPKKNLVSVIDELGLGPVKESLFRESFFQTKTNLSEIKISNEYSNRTMIEENQFKILAEWEYYGLITLLETDDFKSSPTFISKRLGMSVERAKEVIKGLLKAGLVAKDESDNLILTKGPLRTTEDISSRALKKSHKETLEMSHKKLNEVEVELRDFSSMTVAVNPEKLMEAKTIIREFRQKMGALLRNGQKTEVYQLAIQLYPLTQTNKMEK
jgi:uncharacterized protein (TIGR02147 family)